MVVQHQMQESLHQTTSFPPMTTMRPAEAVRSITFILISIPEVGTVDEGSYRMIAAEE
jgi:hypothetical protein